MNCLFQYSLSLSYVVKYQLANVTNRAHPGIKYAGKMECSTIPHRAMTALIAGEKYIGLGHPWIKCGCTPYTS